MHKYQPQFLVLMGLLSIACNPSRVVQPIPKGELQVGANFGGPAIALGSIVTTIPLTSFYANYGLHDNTTAFASLHTTSLLFGVFQTDFGFTHQLVAPQKWVPGFSISTIANVMLDKWEKQFSFYPQVDLNAYWNYGTKKKMVYLSMNNWFELRKTKAHDEPQTTHWLPSIGLGHQWNGSKYDIQAEIKYVAFTQTNTPLVADYVSLNNKGAIGFYIGIHRKF
jgi:hypothetical protein